MSASPLAGIRVVEFANIGPLEHAGMLLADLGADVLRIVRPGDVPTANPILRGRRHRELDLKSDDGRDAVLAEIATADVLLEGFRPGVMERLGLGPAEVAAINPGIVYGRMTGWGQSGPRAHEAGHDITYLALTGVLWATRASGGGRPVPALNLVGDNGGGSLYLVTGVLAALLERAQTGQGSVVDAAIVDGATSLLQTVRGLRAEGRWSDLPADNYFDTGLPWYDTYECADGEYIAVGAIEPQFYAELVRGLGLEDLPDRDDRANHPALRAAFQRAFRTRRRDQWAAVFDGTDACVAPVLSIDDAALDPHLAARRTVIRTPEGLSAAPAPRFEPLPTGGRTK